MSGWNYRVIYHSPSKKILGDKEFDIEEYYAVHEVWYDEEGIPDSYAINPLMLASDIETLKEILDMVKIGIDKEVIDLKYFDKFEKNT